MQFWHGRVWSADRSCQSIDWVGVTPVELLNRYPRYWGEELGFLGVRASLNVLVQLLRPICTHARNLAPQVGGFTVRSQ